MTPLDDEPTFKGTQHPDLSMKLVVAGAGVSTTHNLPARGELTIGRASTNQVPIADASVSRKHALLKLTSTAWTIEDLGSANGTVLNGRALAPNQPATIRPGDVIEVGDIAVLIRGPQPKAPEKKEENAPVVLAESMKALYALIDKVAPANVNVLILGETGAGKEVVAQTIHRRSPRASAPFIGVNCAAFTETLLESELFGHEKGAFTGAEKTKPGLLESAQGGTIFLDEVGELPAGFQAKLLRVLEERQVRRVGSLSSRPIDVRIVAATNRDLDQEVLKGSFRKDLYFRLNGFTLTVPPLRERVVEIEALARHYVMLFAREIGRKREPVLSGEALHHLQRHRWPGNVRELRNVIQRAVLLAGDGPIRPEHLPPLEAVEPRSSDTDIQLKAGERPTDSNLTQRLPRVSGVDLPDEKRREVESLEQKRIQDALEECAGNQTRAAKLLGISRRSLVMKLTKYGMPRPRKRGDET
ncbi:MAG: sigma 54-interacting transcriptional regulator [Planctomycetota bacterium]